MTEFIHLIGTEDVQRAGNNMRAAAEQMTRAANTIDEALRQHQGFMNEWIDRVEAVFQKTMKDLEEI